MLHLLPDEDALRKCSYTPDPARRPYKDLWYLARRYFHYPRQRYDVWAVEECGAVQALLATRCIPVNGTCVLRIVDYTGVPEAFSRLGAAVSRLMADCGAEYADCYCWGIPAQTMAEAGFCARTEDDLNIIPNYLTPPLCENTEYYFFTSEPRWLSRCSRPTGTRTGPISGWNDAAAQVPPFHCNASRGRCVKTSAGFLCVLPKIITTPFFLLPFTLICYSG